MQSAIETKGGSRRPRPLLSRQLGPQTVWTLLVAVTGVVLTGRTTGTGLLALAVIAGLTHGAADVTVAKRSLSRLGRSWWLTFLAGYLALVAAALFVWFSMPAAMLLAFLLLSTIHFGMEDADDPPDRAGWMEVAAHGGAPIVLPAVFHPGEVVGVFAMLAGDRASLIQAIVAGPVALLWIIAVAATVAGGAERKGADPVRPVDLAIVGALFAIASPLIAFALYFALLHTPRAFASQRMKAVVPSPGRIAGLTALACALGAAIFHVGPDLTVDGRIIRTAFMLLSALTVPHMALHLIEHGQSRKNRSRGG